MKVFRLLDRDFIYWKIFKSPGVFFLEIKFLLKLTFSIFVKVLYMSFKGPLTVSLTYVYHMRDKTDNNKRP